MSSRPPDRDGGSDAAAVKIGALAPLSPPGWVEAGRQLLAGLELGVDHVNRSGGVAGRPLELTICDSAADPHEAGKAVEALARSGAMAIVGEYHSVSARAAAVAAAAAGLPFLCSSAVLDELAGGPSRHVARIAPPQSRGWQVYAEWLVAAGHRRVAVLTQPSLYWSAGVDILRRRLQACGGAVIEIHLRPDDVNRACAEILAAGATAALLLLGHPEPAVPVVRAIRRRQDLAHLQLGAPAGQPELADWEVRLGVEGREIPFLRYLPPRLASLGRRVRSALGRRLGRDPSFVALEGYDTILAVADLLRIAGARGAPAEDCWDSVAVEGTRGEIRFSRSPESGVWEWRAAPVQVAERDRDAPAQVRVRRQG